MAGNSTGARALKQGRLEEAHRLLTQPAIRDHRAVGSLLAQLARGYVEHGERQLQLDDAEAAWRDVLAAEQLQTAEKGVARLRQSLVRLGIAEVRALLHAGETRRADEAVARLRERRVRSPEVQVLEEATHDWLQARELADRGEFVLALDAVERVRRRLYDRPKMLEQLAADLERHRDGFAALLVRLHEAADASRWREVIELAEQVLALAPHHAEARKARSRAWKAIEPVTVAMPSPAAPTNGDAVACDGLPTRFMLWIDGVGGYLVCLGGRLTFGQAILDAHVDVPLVADVSRLHATSDARYGRLRAGSGSAHPGEWAAGDADAAAVGRPRDAGRVVPVPVSPAGAGEHVGPARPGERASLAAWPWMRCC